jgi:ketosteroid isomerase-like protein
MDSLAFADAQMAEHARAATVDWMRRISAPIERAAGSMQVWQPTDEEIEAAMARVRDEDPDGAELEETVAAFIALRNMGREPTERA